MCKKDIGYFGIGLGLGIGAAILFAPQSGEETRKVIGDKARATTRLAKLKGIKLRRAAIHQYEHSKKQVMAKRDQVNAAIDAGKMAYREAGARMG